jgi:glyoxylase-like metal-dependent hydrolase (beta-lactamase superfamily II)
MSTHSRDLSRRSFLTWTGALGATFLIDPSRLTADEPRLVVEEPWAGIAELGDRVWAVASTPMTASDWRTGANGGLIAGSDRVLAVDGFVQPDGAAWVAGMAERLAARRPTDVLITHYHGDHANGLEGYARNGDPPQVWMTEITREWIRKDDAAREDGPSDLRLAMLDQASIVPAEGVTEIDLGSRAIELHPRRGHTESDVTVELAEPSVIFGGDLFWNGFFPNYRDTLPTPFAASIRAARRERATRYVPGHGALADDGAIGRLLTLVDAVEEAARDGIARGVTPAEAAAGFELPATVSDWVLFNPRYFETAIGKWYDELGGSAG